MATYLIKPVLLILVTNLILSCNGHVKPNSPELSAVKNTLGEYVSQIDDSIWDVFQDSKGDYWFGSNGKGVYRYNNKYLLLYTDKDGLVSNSIRRIQEDHKGNIYIETPSGVSQFDGTKFTTLTIDRSSNNKWQLNQTDLWFNCNGNASHVLRFDGEKLYELQLPLKDLLNTLDIYESLLSYSAYTVFGIDKDRKGNVWFGTVIAGAFRYDGEAFLWVGDKELSRLEDGREPGVRSMLEDNDGNMWLSNFISKYNIDSTKQQYTKQKVPEIDSIIAAEEILYFNSGLVDHEGNLWMTTYGGIVWHYDGQSLNTTFVQNGEEEVLLLSIFEDKDNTIWLGTFNDGVYIQNGNTFKKFEPSVIK